MRVILCLLLVALGCGDDSTTDAGRDAGDDDASPPLDDGGPDAADSGADSGQPCTWDGGSAEVLVDPPRYTPRWAFGHWISKDISDRSDTETFVTGFLERDIPVSAVVLDSPWETNYNTFVPNPDRYGDFPSLISWLEERDVRLVLWVTQMVNSMSFDLESGGDVYQGPASNYFEGARCDFYVNDGITYRWWKGRGGAVDFFNPEAVAWWREQQRPLLEMGVAGWKLDFGESYIRDEPDSYIDVDTFDGRKSHQEYSEAYYADFYRFGRSVVGDEFVTMVRGYDVSYDVPARFYARPEHAPVVWMGDNHRDWTGLVDALDHTFRSVLAGYVVVGSDIGGYLDRNQDNLLETIPFDQEVFARWVAMEAMTPFFQLHGRANLEPWAIDVRPDETVELYRYWATLHTELTPFWFSLAQEAYRGGPNIVRPISTAPDDWANDWSFRVGDAFFVAPVVAPGSARDVVLPEGQWYDWWTPGAEPIAGPTTIAAYDVSDRRRIPLFVRRGAVIPLQVSSEVTGLGNAASTSLTTVLGWPGEATTFPLWQTDDVASPIELREGRATLPASTSGWLLRLYVTAVSAVSVDGAALASVADQAALDAVTSGWRYDPVDRRLIVKLPPAAASREVSWTP